MLPMRPQADQGHIDSLGLCRRWPKRGPSQLQTVHKEFYATGQSDGGRRWRANAAGGCWGTCPLACHARRSCTMQCRILAAAAAASQPPPAQLWPAQEELVIRGSWHLQQHAEKTHACESGMQHQHDDALCLTLAWLQVIDDDGMDRTPKPLMSVRPTVTKGPAGGDAADGGSSPRSEASEFFLDRMSSAQFSRAGGW